MILDILDIAVNNAEIIYNKISERLDQIDLTTFLRSVARALMGNCSNGKRDIPDSVVQKNPKCAKS